ncbi:hypothetical protein LINGRAPRIM_LOCUS3197 [Linum grandiflorum]
MASDLKLCSFGNFPLIWHFRFFFLNHEQKRHNNLIIL